MRYAWIEAHIDSYPISTMCELLVVSHSGFYAARSRAPSARAVEQAQIVAEIRRAQTRHRGRYGRRHPVAPNVLERDFEATAPNQKWLADLTYIPTDEGWLYLALVLDLFSRKLVGWAMSETMPQELTLAALWVALGWRDPGPGLLHHSDRGSQYAAGNYRKVLRARGITVSMSRKGDCWDNAPMESANGTVKVECVHGEHFRTRVEAQQALVEYIGYYNTERRHSSLGNLSPAAFEQRWHGASSQPSAGVPLQ